MTKILVGQQLVPSLYMIILLKRNELINHHNQTVQIKFEENKIIFITEKEFKRLQSYTPEHHTVHSIKSNQAKIQYMIAKFLY